MQQRIAAEDGKANRVDDSPKNTHILIRHVALIDYLCVPGISLCCDLRFIYKYNPGT